jgi:hypothetical protein
MDLEVLAIRNRIEDHDVCVEYVMTENMAGDMGTKALGLPKFPKFRGTINGYALFKAAYPDLNLPDYVFEISDDDETIPKRGSKLQRVQAMIMKFEVVSLDENFSEDAEINIGSDSEYDPPQRLRGGCDDDNYDEGDDIQVEVEDDFEYDEESACSAHGFDPADRNGDYLEVRLRGGADEDNHGDPDENYDWPADMQDNDPVSIGNYPGLTYKNGYEVDQPLGPLIKLDPYQPDDIYSMKLMSSEGADHHMRISISTLITTSFQRAAMRISQRSQIYRQIQIVNEAYVRRIENHFHKKLDKDYCDNDQKGSTSGPHHSSGQKGA